MSVARLPALVVVSGPMGWSLRRREADPLRQAHADPGPADAAGRTRAHRAFDRLSLEAPWIEVDTTDGYAPGLEEIVAFALGRELLLVPGGGLAERPCRGRLFGSADNLAGGRRVYEGVRAGGHGG